MCRPPGVLWVTVLWRWQTRPQPRGVSAKSMENLYREPTRYGEQQLLTTALSFVCLFIISEILFICWLIGLYFLIAHKIQVKPSDLWKTGKRVSPGGQAELSKVTGTVLMTEPSRSAALTLSLLVVGRCILCLSEISLQMWMMGCFMSFFTIVILPVVVEKWYWTAWATPSKY